MADPQIATDPRGIVHKLAENGMTVCGRNTIGWSRTVTLPYLTGLYVGCEECHADN